VPEQHAEHLRLNRVRVDGQEVIAEEALLVVTDQVGSMKPAVARVRTEAAGLFYVGAVAFYAASGVGVAASS
jgi:hypothetical protein